MELCDVAAVRGEYLYAVVHPVGNINVAVSVNAHAIGAVELADSTTGGTNGSFPFALGRENLDSVVTPVGDIDATSLVQ